MFSVGDRFWGVGGFCSVEFCLFHGSVWERLRLTPILSLAWVFKSVSDLTNQPILYSSGHVPALTSNSKLKTATRIYLMNWGG